MSNAIRTLIADDEPLARERLRKMLGAESDIEIVAEASDGEAAVAAIRKHAPDLVFLDVQMPELDGFGVLAALSDIELPVVVFVTAYDRFALKAFEVRALDYLLKPFDKERLQEALQRVREHLSRHDQTELSKRISELISELRPETKMLERIAVKSEGRVVFVRVDDIDWVEAADNYVSLHVGQESHLHRETMTSLEGKLNPQKFYRISRSTIVNVERIKELQPLFHGDYVVVLRNGVKLNLSRNFRDKLNQLLGRVD